MPRPNVDVSLLPRGRARARSGRSWVTRRGRTGTFAIRRAPSHGEGKGLQEAKDVEPPVVKENWQMDAYSFVEAIGELGYAINLKANTLAECGIIPEVRIPGTDEWQETDDPRVLRTLSAFVPPQGDQGELLRQAALHYEIAGETYLFGQPVHDEHDQPAGMLWEFLSTLELRIESDGRIIRNAWGGSRGRKEVEVDAYVGRLHHRDPRYSERADCPVRRILPICRELVLLTQVVDAVAKSRLPAGLLFVPWEVSFGPEDDWEDPGNADTGFDEFEEELKTHLNAPIEDRTASSSLEPLLMRGPAMIKDKLTKDALGVIPLARELDGIYAELRQEALVRLAGGLDIPPEVISGKSHASHWNAYNIDADFIAKHILPLGRTIMDFLSSTYLRPMLSTFEGMTSAEADWFRFSLDSSPITAETDRSDNATIGVQLEIVSDAAWVKRNGLDDSDMADPDERKRRTFERMLYGTPQLGPAILPVLYPGDPDVAYAVAHWPAIPGSGGAAPPAAGPPLPALPNPNNPPANPSSGGEPEAPRLTAIPDVVYSQILAASDRALTAAIEDAGRKLIARLGPFDSAKAESLRSARPIEVLSLAGGDAVSRAGLSGRAMFDGAWDELLPRVVGWLRTALLAAGADAYDAEQAAAVAAAELGTNLSLLAATALQKPIVPGVNGRKVPSDLLTAALSAGDLSAARVSETRV